MKIYRWKDILTSPKKLIQVSTAISIGVFDGVHRGHRRLIYSVVNFSRKTDSLVITFRQNPALVLRKKNYGGDILSLEQKLLRLEALGVKRVVLIDFSPEFSKLTGEDFIKCLCECLNIEKIVIGYNFRFGHGRNADPLELTTMLAHTNIKVEIINPATYKNEFISSTRIRACIEAGNFGDVREMMEADFILDFSQINAKNMVVRKNTLKYCLPAFGRYRVVKVTTKGNILSYVWIDANHIRIQNSEGFDSVEKMIFLEKIKREE